MKFKSPKPPESVIQLAPMIDIVFLLLIFFLVTWQFSRSEQDSRVKVPTSSQGKEETRAISEINVNIRQNGELVINGEVITEQELLTKLRAIVAVYQNQPVRLRGDGEITYQTLMGVIDICQQAGIWNISFATRRPN
ncbi:MAG: biopolymer transporter ExbD [Roseibacillus sp.]|nr:biopolymer transporter ExbD [Roseibacillus sp.]|tara:strand:- start:961 stop:1371 length:411 start_codon:yes stop_codon:yes gene_type:complete